MTTAANGPGNGVRLVQVDPDRAGQQIRLPLWLDSAVDQLVIRAWLDYTEELEVERVAVVPTRNPGRRG